MIAPVAAEASKDAAADKDVTVNAFAPVTTKLALVELVIAAMVLAPAEVVSEVVDKILIDA
jgi:hypothetical protein